MNRLNFEDTIFILNLQIRMMKDTLRLNPPPELFLEKCLADLAFIDSVLETLARAFLENSSQHRGNGESEYISDAEWQFSQLLTEFSLESSPFSAHFFPETLQKVTVLRNSSSARRKAIEGTVLPTEIAHAEPVVSSVELSSLLGGI
jgi:hypothetical protein